MNQVCPEQPVLIVDDEASWLKSLSLLLERAFDLTHIKTCQDSRQVMALLEQKSASLVLLDMTMPVMSGVETFGHLRQIAPHVPVLFLSGLNEPEELHQHIGQKGTDFLKKPFRLDQLIKKMEGVMVA